VVSIACVVLCSTGLAAVLAVGGARATGSDQRAAEAPIVAAAEVDAVVTRQPVDPGSVGVAEGDGGLAVPPIQRGPWRDPAGRIDQLVYLGDSLAQETYSLLAYLSPGKTVSTKFWGGTAPCDWLSVDLGAGPSSVVVITFTGNSLTDCMSDGRGGHLVDEALIAKYRTDVGVLVDRARQAGARVVLVGQPLRAPGFDADLEVEGINAMYREYAAAFSDVSFVDAGAEVETMDGRYTDRLPCTPFDTDCAADGTTIVRGDGVHFCPIEGQNPCSVWSSGAFRFGSAIAQAANDPAAFD
jgi:hypothetical protein